MSRSEDSEASTSANIPIEECPAFKVYIDRKSLEVRYELREVSELSRETYAFLSRAKLMAAAPTPYLTSGYRLAFKRTIGEAVALAIRGDLQTAEELLASAKTFLADRTGEIARMWYVQATVGLLLLLYALFPLINWYNEIRIETSIGGGAEFNSGDSDTQDDATSPTTTPATDGKRPITAEMLNADRFFASKLYALAVLCGAMGAGFSLLVRVGDLKIDPAAGRWSHYGEVAFRLTIGGLAAVIILIGLQADVFAGFLKVSSENGMIDAELYSRNYWIIGIFSVTAGASERLVPSLLEQLSDRTISESGAKNKADSPNDNNISSPGLSPSSTEPTDLEDKGKK